VGHYFRVSLGHYFRVSLTPVDSEEAGWYDLTVIIIAEMDAWKQWKKLLTATNPKILELVLAGPVG
jgi:hypothetical protein